MKDLYKNHILFKDDYVKSIEKIVYKIRIHKLNLIKNWQLILDNDSETKKFNEAVDNISIDTTTSTIGNKTSTTSH